MASHIAPSFILSVFCNIPPPPPHTVIVNGTFAARYMSLGGGSLEAAIIFRVIWVRDVCGCGE